MSPALKDVLESFELICGSGRKIFQFPKRRDCKGRLRTEAKFVRVIIEHCNNNQLHGSGWTMDIYQSFGVDPRDTFNPTARVISRLVSLDTLMGQGLIPEVLKRNVRAATISWEYTCKEHFEDIDRIIMRYGAEPKLKELVAETRKRCTAFIPGIMAKQAAAEAMVATTTRSETVARRVEAAATVG